jgi:hypothetical protein
MGNIVPVEVDALYTIEIPLVRHHCDFLDESNHWCSGWSEGLLPARLSLNTIHQPLYL